MIPQRYHRGCYNPLSGLTDRSITISDDIDVSVVRFLYHTTEQLTSSFVVAGISCGRRGPTEGGLVFYECLPHILPSGTPIISRISLGSCP